MVKHRIQITDSRVVQAIEMYKSGKAVKPICKELQMDGATLLRFLDELGLRRTRSEAIRGCKSIAKINDNALDILSPEALYWIGFLYADGHIPKDRPRISLTLSEIDKDHLVKFGNFFGENLPLTHTVKKGLGSHGYINNDAFRVQFSSRSIYNTLVSLGFTSRKTWDITPHDLLKSSRDFWRGVIDGDGYLGYKKYKGLNRYATLSLCGHEQTTNAFLVFLRENGIEPKAKSLKASNRDYLWTVTISTNIARDAATLLYQGASVYLDRKYEKYLSWIDPDNEMNRKLIPSPTSILPREEI